MRVTDVSDGVIVVGSTGVYEGGRASVGVTLGSCGVVETNEYRRCVSRMFLRDLSSSSSGDSQSLSSNGIASSSNGVYTVFYSKSTTFHHVGGSVPSGIDCTVLKSSSNTTWYYGGICLVLMFNTNGTSIEWTGLKPRNILLRERGCYLGNFLLAANTGSRTYTGDPHM